MKSALEKYLSQIHAGRPLNYDAFLKQLPPEIAARHRDYFQLDRVSKQRWRVVYSDPEIMEQLAVLASVPATRRQAAFKGDSHRQQTHAAFILVFHSELADDRPDVVCLRPSSTTVSFGTKPNALVIENEDNFASYQQMLSFSSECLGESLSLLDCDVILGGGNRVTRPRVANWLAGYERVLCAFDYDVGGLKMYASLKNQLGLKAVYVQPRAWSRWRHAFQLTPKTPPRLMEAITRANELGFSELAMMFRDTQKFMEQETLLDE